MALKTRVLVVDDSPTVRRVVAMTLERQGFEAVLAEDGRVALDLLEAGTKVDLVLVDFVMPRMNGYQFCRALRDDPRLAATPVVLMSAKSDRIKAQFVEQTEALDAITKPFDGRALVAMVEHALERVRSGRVPAPSGATLLGGNGSIDDEPEEGSTPPPALASATTGELVMAGEVPFMPVGAVLQLLTLEQTTCVLVLTEGTRRIEIALRDGRIDLALSEQAGGEFRLGRFLVELGAVTAADVEDAAIQAATEGGLLGDALLRAGRLRPEQLRAALKQQASELVYEAVRWQKGRYEVRRPPLPALADTARLGLSVAHIIMEGVRRVDEWRVIESALGSFDAVLGRDAIAILDLGDHELSRQEHVVLDAIDGKRTVRQIVDASHMSSFDTCKLLSQLLAARLVRRTGAKEAL